MTILGIETSCDETSASILKDNVVVSNIVVSQLVHVNFGGVVPALASKDHEKLINEVVNKALEDSNCSFSDLDAVSVTQGPGLIGSLMIGLNYAKGVCVGLKIPLVGVNHLLGHIASGFINNNISYPFLCLLVSGGHTQIWKVENSQKYKIISTTVDDAAGEAFDKGARILGMKYPGGPEIEKSALNGVIDNYKFTIPRVKENPLNFSFSGLKTALLYLVKGISDIELSKNISNIAASYQETIIESLLKKVSQVYNLHKVKDVLIVGGVSANRRFRTKADILKKSKDINIIFPNMEYCTDNAAMIAMAGKLKMKSNFKSDLSIAPYSSLNSVDNEF